MFGRKQILPYKRFLSCYGKTGKKNIPSFKKAFFNFRSIKKKAGDAAVIPVIKENAYGHGAVIVAKTLLAEGVKLFAVSKFKEAMELKESGVDTPILILGRLFPEELTDAVKAGFRITLFCNQDILWLQKAKLPFPAYVHVNIDTGFGGAGVRVDNEQDFFNNLVKSASCIFEGLYSQFSTSNETDKTYANLQLNRFKNIVADLEQKNIKPNLIHMANSGAILNFLPESRFNAVRTGIALYGHYPSSAFLESIQLKQVMTFKTFIANISEIPANTPVSYAGKWITPQKTRIATLPVGFTDGINSGLTNKGKVIVKDKLYTMAGIIGMDRTMIDIGDDPIEIGDDVIIWGGSEKKEILLSQLSDICGISLYVLITGVSEKIKRKYITA